MQYKKGKSNHARRSVMCVICILLEYAEDVPIHTVFFVTDNKLVCNRIKLQIIPLNCPTARRTTTDSKHIYSSAIPKVREVSNDIYSPRMADNVTIMIAESINQSISLVSFL